ncbi:MAG TPA: ferredoxin-thioredoxin reductase catalytic domain-containing protein [Methanomassiliicoccales archaeon]|nr:ferredoxin-thioredoxin reductase catalytic domain-containing protein [Methanomassiliicoccales archaeon]
MKKKLWRCHVCGDVHFGVSPPEVCPTCGQRHAFVEIDLEEALQVIGSPVGRLDSMKAVEKTWEEFAERRKFIRLTEDENEVHTLCKGVLENLNSKGLRYCPCRIPSGDPVKDLELICPCNFVRQKNWTEIGECWCGLFRKKEEKV